MEAINKFPISTMQKHSPHAFLHRKLQKIRGFSMVSLPDGNNQHQNSTYGVNWRTTNRKIDDLIIPKITPNMLRTTNGVGKNLASWSNQSVDSIARKAQTRFSADGWKTSTLPSIVSLGSSADEEASSGASRVQRGGKHEHSRTYSRLGDSDPGTGFMVSRVVSSHEQEAAVFDTRPFKIIHPTIVGLRERIGLGQYAVSFGWLL